MRDLVTVVAAITVAILAVIVATAQEPIGTPLNLASIPVGETNWGTLKRDGRNLTIEHKDWTATGLVLNSGKIIIVWNQRSDNQIWVGVYLIENLQGEKVVQGYRG